MKWQEYAYILIIFASIIYIILITLAMILSPEHSFFSNLISDLGRTETYSGESNMISRVLFLTAMSIFGIFVAFLFLALPYHFKENALQKRLSRIGSVCGVISGIAFIGLGSTPSDLFHIPHIFFQVICISLVLLGTALYIILIYLKEDYPNRYAYELLIFAISLGFIGFLMAFAPILYTVWGILEAPVILKVLVYIWAFSYSFLGYGALKLYRSNRGT